MVAMDKEQSARVFPEAGGLGGEKPREDSWLPPFALEHEDLIQELEHAKVLDQETLMNKLNLLNFTERHILAQFLHKEYKDHVLLKAYPDACIDGRLTCRWSVEQVAGLNWDKYEFERLFLQDNDLMIVIPAEMATISSLGFTVHLPQKSHGVGTRTTRRYPCQGVTAALTQGGFVGKGELQDFSPQGFRIRTRAVTPSSFRWLNTDSPIVVSLHDDEQIVFSDICRCIRSRELNGFREIVLSLKEQPDKLPAEEHIRNPRQKLVPQPCISFIHPLLKKRVQLEVAEMSTSGFSVYESEDQGMLLAGMIIANVIIDFAGITQVGCSAQVVYRIEEEKGIRCGFAILDMNVNAYCRLTQILTRALDPHAYVSNFVDMEDLWQFFFETGFIYPEKYRHFRPHRKSVQETYRKVYEESPEIASHFTYQVNGRIYAHMSMLRAYEKTWMLHHHAARNMQGRRPGFTVLKQVMYFLNDMYRLPSAKMDYAMCFFRPESKFPDHVFGGYARELGNPGKCSMDLFSYLFYPALSLATQLPGGWSLKESSKQDLWELNRHYQSCSGGLLLKALGLEHRATSEPTLEDFYRRYGFQRRWKTYSLKEASELMAVLLLDQSDLGLNLSDLINSIKVFVVKPEAMPWKTLSMAIWQLTPLYNTQKVPILIHPAEYAEQRQIRCEKQYQMWVYDTDHVSDFIKYGERKYRISYWK